MLIDDKTAFIIGTGPSLNKIDISKLKDQKTITFNRAYVAFEDWGFDPTYYLAIDGNDIRSLYKDINNLILNSNSEKFFLLRVEDNHLHKPIHFQDEDYRGNDELYVKSDKLVQLQAIIGNGNGPMLSDTNDDGNTISTPIITNAGFMGLKMLYHLGYRKIFLCGMDARYTDDKDYRNVLVDGKSYKASSDEDINHFRNDYFGKDVFFGKPNQEEIIHIWKTFMTGVKPKYYPDLEIYSCSENSNLNPFMEYIDFNTLF